jgi:methylglyoxal synthase
MIELRSTIKRKKRIALIAHNHKKDELLQWAEKNRDLLFEHKLFSTQTTGSLLEKNLNIKIKKYKSGPLGGDLQIGAKIVKKKIDILIFFWDPLEAQPHDPDVKALLRAAVVWDIPMACNQATASFILSSDMMNKPYQHILEYPDF